MAPRKELRARHHAGTSSKDRKRFDEAAKSDDDVDDIVALRLEGVEFPTVDFFVCSVTMLWSLVTALSWHLLSSLEFCW